VKHVRTFRCHPEAVTAARQYVRAVLDGRPREIAEAAELMTSELATNCVRHARTDFELTVRDGAQLRIELRDTGPGEPRRQRPAPRDLSGRGLLIVDRMSDDWGVVHGTRGKTVWFSLDERVRAGAEKPAHGAEAGVRRGRWDTRAAATPGGRGRGPAAQRVTGRSGSPRERRVRA
jgi:anti-sigma regulatory factor (Ser/Thr protein kinase)